jgi:hypothetical protein
MQNQPTILLVGGDIRPGPLQKLIRSLPGYAVEWLPTRETDAGPSRFQSRLGRPGVVLVVILKGLLRHQHTHALLRLCRRHGLRWLHLFRSPNAARIVQALAPCSALGRSATPPSPEARA